MELYIGISSWPLLQSLYELHPFGLPEIWLFPKIRSPILVVPIMRTILFGSILEPRFMGYLVLWRTSTT